MGRRKKVSADSQVKMDGIDTELSVAADRFLETIAAHQKAKTDMDQADLIENFGG